MSASGRAWVLVGGAFVAGIGLLWWAHEQWISLSQISVETAQMPSGRMLLWILTLVVTGFAFGLAVSFARPNHQRGRPGILLTLAFIPFAVLYYFWTQITLDWFPTLPDGLAGFLYTESSLLAASLILGLLLSGLIGRPAAADEEPVAEPDSVSDEVDVETVE